MAASGRMKPAAEIPRPLPPSHPNIGPLRRFSRSRPKRLVSLFAEGNQPCFQTVKPQGLTGRSISEGNIVEDLGPFNQELIHSTPAARIEGTGPRIRINK